MGRNSRTRELVESGLGQHLALPVAAHLARSQLIPDPLKPYGARPLSETLDLIAAALIRVAPVYLPEAGGPREVTAAELEGAVVRRGATELALRDGRAYRGVTLRRADLRQAVAILKTTGIPELVPPRAAEKAPPEKPRPPDLIAQYRDLEHCLQSRELDKASALAVRIARQAPEGPIANLAMQLVSAVSERRDISAPLARLRSALEQASPDGGRPSA